MLLNCGVEKTLESLESPLDYKEIQPVNPKGNQSWIFIGRTDAEAENSVLWPPDGENWLFGKDSDAEKDWRQGEWLNWTELVLLTLSGHLKKDSEKAMATHSSTLAWKLPWTEEPGRLQSMGLQRGRHDWATSLSCIGEGNGKTHSIVLSWRIPRTEKPGTGSHRVDTTEAT